MADKNEKLILSIDQGTSSSRVLLFSPNDWSVKFVHQKEFASLYPNEGWSEQDPMLLLNTVKECLNAAAKYLEESGSSVHQVVGVGITNQRETTIAWDKTTGKPLHNAIVWHDTRTKDIVSRLKKKELEVKDKKDELRKRSGLPLSTYFSAVKLRWLLENCEEIQNALKEKRLMVGTVDTWLIWNLTNQKKYVTDVTNASRTMLMNIKTLKWDDDLCAFFDIDPTILANICSSSERLGLLLYDGCPFPNVPITGCLGDQQAALVGQQCFTEGMAKNTYGTGCFMLYNVGQKVVHSNHGLLATVGYQFGETAKPVYALEGSIATAGEAVKWLKTVGLISNYQEIEEHAKSVDDTGGMYFVPAFNGLFAPHWRTDARGTMVGITQYTRKGHICRATLESVAFQTWEILNSMQLDSKLELKALLVDGGMTKNELLMQTQADFLGIDVIRPKMVETTALGAAMASAYALGLWDFQSNEISSSATVFKPKMEKSKAIAKFARWKDAISKSVGWCKDTNITKERNHSFGSTEILDEEELSNAVHSPLSPSFKRKEVWKNWDFKKNFNSSPKTGRKKK